MNAGQHTRYPVRYLKRQDIDTRRWDDCIDKASNGLIYGLHVYLDHMARGHWDALVYGDYEAVMPLPWRRKFSIKYSYQPSFTQQGGIFFLPAVTALIPDLIESFLKELRAQFRFSEIFLNYANPYPGLPVHKNYILPLDAPYDELASGYNKDLARNLRLANENPLDYLTDFSLEKALESFEKEYAARLASVRKEDYHSFKSLCMDMRQRDQLLVRAVYGQTQLLACAVVLRDHRRLYLLQSTTFAEGRKRRANHFLLDKLIREFAATGLLFDFEGSDIRDIGRFYENFGSKDQPYFFYRHNQMPWPIRLLKP
jgi:hypothetical protein